MIESALLWQLDVGGATVSEVEHPKLGRMLLNDHCMGGGFALNLNDK